MTPEMKAFELVQSFYFALENDDKARAAALIAVDEIIDNEDREQNNVNYWLEVRKEVEKL